MGAFAVLVFLSCIVCSCCRIRKMAVYDAIVIGAGIEGSSAALQLARNGRKTLLLDQFPLPHTRGSSGGESRIIRYAYEEKMYAVMMNESYEEWFRIERESKTQIYVKSGYLTLGKVNDEIFPMLRTNMKLIGREDKYKEFTNSELRLEYPMMNIPDDYIGSVDSGGGVLLAGKALQAIQMLFAKRGGVLKDGHQVKLITPGSVVTIKTDRETFAAKAVVICAGPWAPKLLRQTLELDLPIQPILILSTYWQTTIPGLFSSDVFPTFNDRETNIWGLPSIEYPGLIKMGINGGPSVDPDRRDSSNYSTWMDKISSYVQNCFPTVKLPAAIIEPCMFSLTPDQNYIVDHIPGHKNIIIGAGFSGKNSYRFFFVLLSHLQFWEIFDYGSWTNGHSF